jgi:magnesium transporter
MLVNCVAYQEGQRVADITVAEIGGYLKRPDCFVWVAIRDPEPDELDALQKEFDLPDLAVEDARHGHQRPKIEEYEDSLFVVLQPVEKEGDELRVGEVAIFVGARFALTVRRGVQAGFAGVRRRAEHEPELLKHGPAYVLYALMDAVVDRYFPIVDEFTDEIERIEERIFGGQTTRAQIEALYELKRKLMIVKHAAAQTLEVTSKLHGGRVPPACAGLDEYFRDVYDHLVRLNQSIDGLRDTVTTATAVNLSLIQIQENEVTKRLAAWAALIAVPTMVAGIYGMNFRHMPELSWKLGYPIVMGAVVAIDGYLVYRFRKAKWL